MERIIKLARGIPALDSLISFGSRMGLWSLAGSVLTVAWALAMTVWAWVWSELPPWGVALVGIFSLTIIAALVNLSLAAWLKFRQVGQIQKIDRTKLSLDAENIAREIWTLLGENHSNIKKAWWKDTEHFAQGQMEQDRYQDAIGNLISKFSERHYLKAVTVIRMAAKLGVHSERRWGRMSFSVSSEHDIQEIANLLAQISVDLKYE